MITKLKSINNLAVFQNFDWDTTVRDKGNNIALFKKLNIFYGRNYSGKTSLSRILRCFEKKELHNKYPDVEFQVIDSNDTTYDQQNLENFSSIIKVYNKDFIHDNLRWLTDENGSIEPFAIVGGDNVETEKQIEKLNEQLGSEEDKTGFRGEMKRETEAYQKKKQERDKQKENLDKKLRDKANNSIKTNPIYLDVNYNIRSIQEDISIVLKENHDLLTEETKFEHLNLLKETPKEDIENVEVSEFMFNKLLSDSSDLLIKEITISKSIQEYKDNPELQEWARTGIGYHKGKRTECGFCGSVIPEELWKKLEAHFNEESEKLRQEIEKIVQIIKNEKEQVGTINLLKENDFYVQHQKAYLEIIKQWNVWLPKYIKSLNSLKKELNHRLENIFTVKEIPDIKDYTLNLLDLIKKLNELVETNNAKTKSLSKDQISARDKLRINEVNLFIRDIKYNEEVKKIEKLNEEEVLFSTKVTLVKDRVKKLENKIDELELTLKDETKAADKINEYLNHFFGHKGLQLIAEQTDSSIYKFSIKRGNDPAYNLSEGECSLVSFCYFMAKLQENNLKETIIWIDDPISSLDSNHIFFVYSLIENVIAKPEKKDDGSNDYRYKQLFISTHNLDFLKYLKKISMPKNDVENFIIERTRDKSSIKLMPKYLRNNITEFNYLFHQIYKCATVEDAEDFDTFYNFGNNLRKFLEAYLFYKFPVNKPIIDKLRLFFDGDSTSTDIVNRVDNELSHLEEIFDRSIHPIEIPEIPTVAKYVLKKLKEKDESQFAALCESVEVSSEINL